MKNRKPGEPEGPTLQDFVKGKSIALVGNAESLFTQMKGKEIDDHDIVIRINRPAIYFDDRKYKKTHGKRNDVWAFWDYRYFLNRVKPETNPPRLMQALEDRSINILNMNQYLTREHFIFNEHQCFPSRNRILNRYTVPGIVMERNFSTGMYIMALINEYDFDVMNVYGFDFQRTATFNEPDQFKNIINGERRYDMACCHEYENEERIANDYFFIQKRINYCGVHFTPAEKSEKQKEEDARKAAKRRESLMPKSNRPNRKK